MFEIKVGGPAERKSLMNSLILSIIILGTGLIWAYRIGLKTLPLEHALGHAAEDVEFLHKAARTPPKGIKR